MANFSKVKLPDNTTYDIISMQTRSVIFCRPTVTSTASAFKVNVPSISSLYNGLSLYIYNNIATSVANATLELNNFGAKSIKINGGADDVGNYWRYGRAYLFVFDSVTNRWIMNYTDIDTVSLTQAQYDALVTAGTVDPNVIYCITDRNNTTPTYAAGIAYDNTDSGLDATNVQNAIDELAETGGGAGVSVLTYAEYQELVDAGEVNPDISYYISDSNTTGTNYAAGISYDNTESGMAATDVQEAIDELAPVKSNIGNIDNVTITSPSVGDTLTWNGTNWVNGGVVDFASQIQWNSNVTVELLVAYKFFNICVISFAIRANGLQGQIATLPHLPNGKYFNRIQNNNNDGCQYIVAYTENNVGKLGLDVAPTGAGLLIGEIIYLV